MREILFRGKRVDNGEWVEGNYEWYHKPEKHIISNPYTGETKGVLSETVGQYTGLTDKNGEKIFEGDIVIADFDYKKEPMEVIYYKCGFKLKSKHCKEVYDYSIHDETPEIKVIGNIHDNPEFLEVEE